MIAVHLVEAAAEGGLVLVVEDAHWADASSLLLLRYLVDDLATARLHAVVTCRVEGEPGGDLPRLAGSRAIFLSGLAHSDVNRYLELRLGADFAAAHHSEIHRRTDGSPLYLAEMVRLVEAGGSLQSVPSEAREVINRRLATLPVDTRRILELAAVIGSDADLQLLADAAGQSAQDVAARLDAAVAARIVTPSPGPPAGFRFGHDLLREALYDQLPPSVRLHHHRAAAEAVERLWAADLGDHLAALAHHWQRSGAGLPQAVEWTLRAADHAVDRLAFDDGSRLYEAALKLPGAVDHTQVLLKLARAQYLAGQIQLSFETCQRIVRMARRQASGPLLADAALVLEGIADPTVSGGIAQMCEEALEALGDDEPALRARLLGQLTTQVTYSDFPRVANLSTEALALAERSGDTDALIAGVRARQLARSGPDGVWERLELAKRMIEVGSSTRRPRVTMWGRLWRIDAYIQLAEMSRVDEEQSELQALVDRIQLPLARWHLVRLQSARAAFEGRFEAAVELGEDARHLGRRGGHGETQWIAFRIGVADQLGDTELLADLLPKARTTLPVQRLLGARILLRMGRDAEARAVYEVGAAQLKAHALDHQWLTAASALTEVACRLGATQDAEWLYPRLQPFADEICVSGAGPPVFIRGGVALWLGMLATLLGKPEAGAYLEQAVALHDRLGARPFAAHSRVEYARHLTAAGHPRQARKLAVMARDVASELGMAPLAADASVLLNSLRTGAEASPLSRRETEIAEQVAQGLTNKQIATALFLSERTVETHVQNILGKLGFRTRSQIAAWAAGRAGD
jgi:DNA-binding CsgD family transcriptional regulator